MKDRCAVLRCPHPPIGTAAIGDREYRCCAGHLGITHEELLVIIDQRRAQACADAFKPLAEAFATFPHSPTSQRGVDQGAPRTGSPRVRAEEEA